MLIEKYSNQSRERHTNGDPRVAWIWPKVARPTCPASAGQPCGRVASRQNGQWAHQFFPPHRSPCRSSQEFPGFLPSYFVAHSSHHVAPSLLSWGHHLGQHMVSLRRHFSLAALPSVTKRVFWRAPGFCFWLLVASLGFKCCQELPSENCLGNLNFGIQGFISLISGFKQTSLLEMTKFGPILFTRVHWPPAVHSSPVATLSPGLRKTVTGHDVPSMSESKTECEVHVPLQVGYVVSANTNSINKSSIDTMS